MGGNVTMSKQPIQPSGGPAAIGPYSPAIRVGDLVFCSGQIPIEPGTGALVDGDVVAQTERVMKNLAALLEASGADLGKVVKTTIFLVDLADFAKVNETYGKYFTSAPPARSTIQVCALPKGARVEIEAIAHLGA
jgi:2-iminobutanoate/2-iminopropanoate deaminase